VEIALSMLIKVVAVLILGAPALAVLLFEVILNAMAMFNHANWRLPSALDRILRQLLVTPDMHRVHHTVYPDEHHRNFGFNLSIWDRLFGTYVAQPRDGHTGTRIGLPEEQGPRPLRLPSLLSLPFRR
jgi:sterol desaturase/sphingolipid hydroxylase (fatty acid hydroxylase superfamily)